MTEITDAMAAEVLWASSEQGKAAVRAGWERAESIGVRADLAEVGAVVYAAYLAAGWDGETEPGEDEPELAHLHSRVVLAVQPYTPWVVIGKPVPYTIVLMRCSACGEPETRTLLGTWTVEDLQVR
jgi:hypothetical protein